LLRGSGLPVGPDLWQNVYDLLLALNAQGRLPQRSADLEHLIAPLLCRSVEEQRQFGERFAHWLAGLEPDLRGSETEAAATTADTDAPPQPPPSPSSSNKQPPSPPSADIQPPPPPETKGLTLQPVPPRPAGDPG